MAVSKKKSKRFWQWLAALLAVAVLAAGGFLWKVSRPETSASQAAMNRGQTALAAPLCIQKLPVAEQAGQVLMVGLTAESLAAQAPVFKQFYIGGAVMMTSPADPYDGSIKRFKTAAGNKNIPLLISTDEEGGDVQRFKSLGVLPDAAGMAAQYSPSQAQAIIAAHAKKLKAIGIDMVLGPLADVAPAGGESPLGNRVFSDNPQTVSNYDLAYVRGWQAGGLLPTLKHFPGMGSASGNTDFQPATTPPLDSLKQNDFIPYRTLLSGGAAIMIGNQQVPDWSGGPASLSPTVNEYLRNTLGYKDSLVVTDSLAAQAINSQVSVSDAVVQAIAAGNDIAIIVDPNVNKITVQENTDLIQASVNALESAVSTGKLPKSRLAQAVQRKLAAQNISPCSLL